MIRLGVADDLRTFLCDLDGSGLLIVVERFDIIFQLRMYAAYVIEEHSSAI